jgi:uncharacterized phage-associated protein
MKAMDIAYRIIKLAKDNPDLVPDLSHLKLQKILFFTAAWYAANKDARLFDEDIYAWKYGPVVPDIYDELKRFSSRDLLKEDQFKDVALKINEDPELDDDIKSVLEHYGKMSTYELVARTHNEWVWRKNYGGSNELMPFEEIKDSFKRKLVAV